MTRNMGTADKLLRILIAVVIATLYYKEIVTGAWGVVLLIVAGIFLFTSIISWCPMGPSTWIKSWIFISRSLIMEIQPFSPRCIRPITLSRLLSGRSEPMSKPSVPFHTQLRKRVHWRGRLSPQPENFPKDKMAGRDAAGFLIQLSLCKRQSYQSRSKNRTPP